MSTVAFLTIALLVAIIIGAALTAWLWTTHCPHLVTMGGLRALAAMRWREFSRFVIEALQAQGFEASRIEPDAQRGQRAKTAGGNQLPAVAGPQPRGERAPDHDGDYKGDHHE